MDLLGNYSESSSEEEPEPEPVKPKKPKVWLPPPDLATAAMKADDEKEFIYRSKVRKSSAFLQEIPSNRKYRRKIIL